MAVPQFNTYGRSRFSFLPFCRTINSFGGCASKGPWCNMNHSLVTCSGHYLDYSRRVFVWRTIHSTLYCPLKCIGEVWNVFVTDVFSFALYTPLPIQGNPMTIEYHTIRKFLLAIFHSSPLLACINQPKGLAKFQCYRVVIITVIHANRLARWLEGKTGETRCHWWREMWRGSVLWASFRSLSILKFFMSLFYKEGYSYPRGGQFDEIREPNFKKHLRQESWLLLMKPNVR